MARTTANSTITVNGIMLYYHIETDEATGKKCAVITGADWKVAKAKDSLEIPAEIKKIPVTSIGKDAFYSAGFTRVTIPDGVTTIGEGAFKDCYCLTSVTIPDSVTRIEHCAFWGCRNLFDTETIPGVKLVDGWVIHTDSVCRHLNLRGVRGLGEDAFLNNNLTSVTIPSSVRRIRKMAFSGCRGLKSVTIDCASIEEQTFLECSGLRSVTIGNGVTSIGVYAFLDCSGLTGVTLPDSVTSIENNAFLHCSKLAKVSLPRSLKGKLDEEIFFIGSSAGLKITYREAAITKISPAKSSGVAKKAPATSEKKATAPKAKGVKAKPVSAKKPVAKKPALAKKPVAKKAVKKTSKKK